MKHMVFLILGLLLISSVTSISHSTISKPEENKLNGLPTANGEVLGRNGSFPYQFQAFPFEVKSRVTASDAGFLDGNSLPDAVFSSYVGENITIYFNNNGILSISPDRYINAKNGIYHPTDVVIMNGSIAVACHNESSTGINNYDRVKIYNFTTTPITLNPAPLTGIINSVILISLVSGDFNDDGNIDIAAAFSTYSTSARSSKICVYYAPFSDGQTPSVNISAGNNITRMASGDFNGDGRDDIAVISDGGRYIDVFISKTMVVFHNRQVSQYPQIQRCIWYPMIWMGMGLMTLLYPACSRETYPYTYPMGQRFHQNRQ